MWGVQICEGGSKSAVTPADLYDEIHLEWAPTKNMGHSLSSVLKPSSQSALAQQKRAKAKQEAEMCTRIV